MPKFVCSVDTRYLPDWKTQEGLREMLQNGRDSEIQNNAKLNVKWRRDTQVLVIENDGAVLPLKALLIGFSSKREDRRLAGQYGEGLVFGILALVRNGHAVKIRTGGEVWIPRMEKHEQVDEEVLVFAINKGNLDQKRVAIEIDHVTEAMWKELPKRFLFLNKSESKHAVKTVYGTLLIDAEMRGDVFVKGIWMCHDHELACGYDFDDCETDRDRKMIESYNLRDAMNKVWRSALVTRPDLIWPYMDMLNEQKKDVEGIDQWSAPYIEESMRRAIAADFVEKYGSEAVPVLSLGESVEMEHFGKKGIVVSKSMKSILETILGKTSDLKIKLAKEAMKLYSWSALNSDEQQNLEQAVEFINNAHARGFVPSGVQLDVIDVTDFRDEKIRGLFNDDRIFLAKKILSDRSLTLRVLVHEKAHMMGGDDGEKNHVSNIEMIWAGIVETLRPVFRTTLGVDDIIASLPG